MRYFISILFFCISYLVVAQGKITLTVLNPERKPIEFANFRLFQKDDSSVINGAYSNSKGQIKLENIPFGDYSAKLNFFGFEEYIINNIHLDFKSNSIDLGSITLSKMKGQTLGAVVIKGKQEQLSERTIAKRTYNVSKDMTSMGGSVEDVLRNIPSVEVDQDGNVSLRGNGSVTILIDGRPSVLSSSGEGALDGIPASAIEKIEVVTNPSAKYNPDGTAGIINIVLKKQLLKGFNLTTQITAASLNLYNGSLNFNYRNRWVNFFASYSFKYREGERNSFTDRTSSYNDTTEFLSQSRLGTDLRRSHMGQIGADFFIKANQTLGVSASGAFTIRSRSGNQENQLSYNNQLNEYWTRKLNSPRNRKSLDLNANYKLDFNDKKGNFIATVTESMGDEDNRSYSDENYFDPDGNPLATPYWYQNQFQLENKNKLTISADLVRSIGNNIKYQAGLQAIFHHQFTNNNLISLDTTVGAPDVNTISNNKFDFKEQIYSAYGTFGQSPVKWFEYQLGLRLEQALSTPKLINTNQKYNNDYFSFFPTAHLSFGTDSTGKFYASYSRRINRPNTWNLNPYTIKSDPRNLRQGNPDLKPEYINSYEIGYMKDWEKVNFTGSVYFKETNNKIQRVRQFFDNQVAISTFQNIDKSYDYGLELVFSYSPFSWWKNMLSANAYERVLNANFNGTLLNNKGISWDLKLNTTFSLFDNTTNIQVNAQYFSPRYDVQGYLQFQPGIDIGITRSLLDRNLTIGLRVSDIFNQKSFYFEAIDQNQIQQSSFKWTSRRLYLTLSYKIGNLRVHNENKLLRKKVEESQQQDEMGQ